ncbi:RimK family alpha-L-glutamate ligase [Streptomyces benahoarensis]|uniref:RimK family alpha-L-glutamate ligase n=2 Tax=Streptomyces benahoarensis TaxID=2595054 RepID=A0A553Z744_9ACTN|nr:RimK family alpha-L-glutamate ligase [Streptomyces benahoarensis]TSB37269.1 RimK family alpha-L-glutamate ligase [Streptomyces benahoarensis]
MLVREQPMALGRATQELATALAATYGPRFAVWHTDELLFGVHEGQLVLRTLGGADVPAPEVVCVRQMPGSMRDDREVTLLRHLERMGSTLLNPLGAHLTCRNKVWQMQELSLAGLPVPDTLSYATAPLEGVVRNPYLEAPCVVKAVSGTKGRQVFLAPDQNLLSELAGSLTQEVPFLFQEHVASSHGRALRVVVVDGEPVGAVLHTSGHDALAANIGNGGSADLCSGRYPKAEELAVEAATVLALDIAGVDLLFAADGAYTLCEVNAVPGWRPAMTTVAPAITACVNRRLTARDSTVRRSSTARQDLSRRPTASY